ncbi:hypothetical protein [Dactylosporangium sp. CS-033363]|uniref:hypothetical protein n=1 Tax=Dactylosporangium sp. CS-033363 TaxID=3239935 RepID=UPI003D8DAAB9
MTAPVAIPRPVDVADVDRAARLVVVPLERFPHNVLPQDWCTVVAGDTAARARVQGVDKTRKLVYLQIDPAGLQPVAAAAAAAAASRARADA